MSTPNQTNDKTPQDKKAPKDPGDILYTVKMIGGASFCPERGVKHTEETGPFQVKRSVFESLNYNNPIFERVNIADMEG